MSLGAVAVVPSARDNIRIQKTGYLPPVHPMTFVPVPPMTVVSLHLRVLSNNFAARFNRGWQNATTSG